MMNSLADTTEFETLEELRADVKAKLEEEAKNAAETEMRNALVEKVVCKYRSRSSRSYGSTSNRQHVNGINYQLQYQGLNLEQLLQMTGRAIDELKQKKEEMKQKD